MISSPTVDDLCQPFFAVVPQYELIAADDVPEPYHGLLVHTNHMTVTVEGFYQQSVDVEVLSKRVDGSHYSRKILLATAKDHRVVQFGIVNIDLDVLPTQARKEILSGSTPLGRVLIQNNILTRVEPQAYLRLAAQEQFAELFAVPAATILFGRIGVIYAGNRKAIEMLEVLNVTPSR